MHTELILTIELRRLIRAKQIRLVAADGNEQIQLKQEIRQLKMALKAAWN